MYICTAYSAAFLAMVIDGSTKNYFYFMIFDNDFSFFYSFLLLIRQLTSIVHAFTGYLALVQMHQIRKVA